MCFSHHFLSFPFQDFSSYIVQTTNQCRHLLSGRTNYNCQSFLVNILSFTCREILRFTVHSVHSSHFNKIRLGLGFFWLVVKNQMSIDDTSTNPVSALRAICVLFKIFASSLTLHKNAGLDVLF